MCSRETSYDKVSHLSRNKSKERAETSTFKTRHSFVENTNLLKNKYQISFNRKNIPAKVNTVEFLSTQIRRELDTKLGKSYVNPSINNKQHKIYTPRFAYIDDFQQFDRKKKTLINLT